uniref:CSON007177 protein n=1 Tax=Culicoides sonorensis TaxID=179676 RepID=A0A336L9S7_CULSO
MSFFDSNLKIWRDRNIPSIYNPNASVGQILLYGLKRGGENISQISDDFETQHTFNEIRLKSIKVAMNFKSIGVKFGDICGVIARNNPDLAPIVFGCIFLGAPVNTLDPSFDCNDLEHMLGLTKPGILFAEEDNLNLVKNAVKKLNLNTKIFCFTDKIDDPEVNSVEILFENSNSNENPDDFLPTPIPDTQNHIAVIVCSSGTTGLSKGVCLSHAQVNSQLLRAWPCITNKVLQSFSSIYWITGLVNLLQGTVDNAIRIITTKPFTPECFFEIVAKHNVTDTFLSPSQIVSLLESEHLASANLSSIEICLTGGSFILENIRSEFQQKLGKRAKVMSIYGMTELGTSATWNSELRPNSVGFLIHQNMVKIIDDNGNPLGPNEKGEICMKPPFTFLGYFDNEKETNEFRDSEGWMHSGDLGYFDENGYLFISVAVDDLEHGTDLPAVVIVRPSNFKLSEEEITKILNENLVDVKKLRGGIYFVEKLPMTPSGKIQQTRTWSGPPMKSVFNTDYNLGQLLMFSLEKNPEKITQINADSGTTLTCGELRSKSIRVANALKQMGFKTGDIMMIAARNHPDICPALFGCFIIGAPVNVVDVNFSKDDVAHMIQLLKPKMIFFIMCSSGTTGMPKGVCLSHTQLIEQVQNYPKRTSQDIALIYSSLYWISGMAVTIHSTIVGYQRVVTTQPFTPKAFFDIIENYQIKTLFGSPVMMMMILRQPDIFFVDFGNVKELYVGGGIVTPQLRFAIERVCKIKMMIAYGMTETAGIMAYSRDYEEPDGSVGVVANNMSARIIDKEGNALEPNQIGEIQVYCKHQFLGYYNNEEATEETLLRDGWLRTGDLGYFDDRGYLFIVGRDKDTIKYMGHQISPIEIESIIQRIPGVIMSCVVGIPDELYGDLPAAAVVKMPGIDLNEDDIKEAVASRLSDFKQLRGGVYFIEGLPRTVSGKVKVHIVRDMLKHLYEQRSQVKNQISAHRTRLVMKNTLKMNC